jgi:hypothetical protein
MSQSLTTSFSPSFSSLLHLTFSWLQSNQFRSLTSLPKSSLSFTWNYKDRASMLIASLIAGRLSRSELIREGTPTQRRLYISPSYRVLAPQFLTYCSPYPLDHCRDREVVPGVLNSQDVCQFGHQPLHRAGRGP